MKKIIINESQYSRIFLFEQTISGMGMHNNYFYKKLNSEDKEKVMEFVFDYTEQENLNNLPLPELIKRTKSFTNSHQKEYKNQLKKGTLSSYMPFIVDLALQEALIIKTYLNNPNKMKRSYVDKFPGKLGLS